MKKKRLFLQWAAMASLIVVGAILAMDLGYAKFVRNDPTHFTYVALTAFAVATVWCGRLAWMLSSGRDPDDLEIDLKLGHYASSFCVSIGLLGTAVGYLIMFQHGTVEGDAKTVMHQIFGEASVALVNTVLGGICGVLVEIQSQVIGHGIDKARKRAAKAAAPARPEASGPEATP